MENARALDERLRRIIREIGSNTGSEIKKNLLEDLENNIKQIVREQTDINTRNTLMALRQTLKKF